MKPSNKLSKYYICTGVEQIKFENLPLYTQFYTSYVQKDSFFIPNLDLISIVNRLNNL